MADSEEPTTCAVDGCGAPTTGYPKPTVAGMVFDLCEEHRTAWAEQCLGRRLGASSGSGLIADESSRIVLGDAMRGWGAMRRKADALMQLLERCVEHLPPTALRSEVLAALPRRRYG